jgi:DNA-binding LytR/AlgR family response regulator
LKSNCKKKNKYKQLVHSVISFLSLVFNQKKHIIEHPLDELERLLNPKDFFRINRKLILNIKAIQKISPHFNGRLKLELTPQYREEVFVARERVGDFKGWLGG